MIGSRKENWRTPQNLGQLLGIGQRIGIGGLEMDEFQIYEQRAAKDKLPERNLLAAVLYRAVLDLVDNDWLVRENARAWIRFRGPSKEGLTVDDCCLALDLNATEFRDACLKSS